MVVTLLLIKDGNGDLHDYEGHQHNATGQYLDDQWAIIPEPEADVLEDA